MVTRLDQAAIGVRRRGNSGRLQPCAPPHPRWPIAVLVRGLRRSWFLLSMLSGEGRLRRCGRGRLLFYGLNPRTQPPKRDAYMIANFRRLLCLSTVDPYTAVAGHSLGAVFL